MAEIQPFQGVLYDTQRVRPDDVLTQPYDKITPDLRERYLERSPYNLIRIELGKEQPGDTETSNKYTRARDLFREWMRQRILRRSAHPSLYYLEQTFEAPDGSQLCTRRALIARVRLSHWDEGKVLPHEHTLAKPKVDRLSLLRACGAQQGQIFMLYPTPSQPILDLLGDGLAQPVLETHQNRVVRDQGLGRPHQVIRFGGVNEEQVTNSLWEISAPPTVRAVQDALRDLNFYIADGHHRYETALAFRDECRAAAPTPDPNAPAEFVMATLVDMADPGLVILPTHRTVANLPGFDHRRFRGQLAAAFTVEARSSLADLLGALRGPGEDADHRIGMADADGFTLLRPRDAAALRPQFEKKPALWHRLDVAILHVAILERYLGIDEVRLREEANVRYWREPEQAADQVQRGAAQLAFLLNPTRVADVQAIADARSRMPQKSTDFYPKLLSGLVMYEVGSRQPGAE